MELETLLEVLRVTAAASLAKDGELLRTVFTLRRDGSVEAVIGIPASSAAEDNMQVAMLRTILQSDELDGYVVVAEVWLGEEGDPVSPSVSQKQEGVLIYAETKQGERVMRGWAIERGPDGTPTMGRDLELSPACPGTGTMGKLEGLVAPRH
jgi:hypothetical protein